MTELYVQTEQDIFEAMKVGNMNRTVASTSMNVDSSRSHMVFVLTVQQKNLVDHSQKVGKLYLVDLAGSEKVSKSEVTGKLLEEAKQINLSLSVLGRVIFALTESNPHVPYRDSKLTRMLQESLGGNAKTSLVITCSPASYNESETLSTLRFGSRAKMIKNKAKMNRERTTEELQAMLDTSNRSISRLKHTIAALQNTLETNGIVVPKIDLSAAQKGGVDIAGEVHEDMQDLLNDMKNDLAMKSEEVTDLRRNYDESVKTIRHFEEKMATVAGKTTEFEAEREALAYEREEQNAS